MIVRNRWKIFVDRLRLGGALCLAVAAMSCASTTYKEPQTGERARIRFALARSVPDAIVVIRSYEDDDCGGEREWMRLKNGMYLVAKPKRLNMPLWDYHDNGAQEFFVPTERPLRFLINNAFQVGLTVYSCSVFVTATPKAGKDYEFVFEQLPGNSCQVALNELTNGDATPQRQTLRFFDNAVANDACLAVFKKTRWS